MWLGLSLRIWSVVTLGASFRTTVEVDQDQQVINKGPYRWVRHPSYTGLLIIAAGYGIAGGNWVSLVILLVVPLTTMLYRIRVEEAVMAEVLGSSYLDYQQGTKRLVPGLW
jgi:protein-S-isoprenylcysteine O-methyltransferase Ste14